MLGHSSGSWQRRKASSEAGSPAKQTGEPGHPRNWRCGCKPGILGPPLSPIPPLLRCTVETTAAGPPTSWKITQEHSRTIIELNWQTNLDYPSNPNLLFPPAPLTFMTSLNAQPSCWSLENTNDKLLCSLSWSSDAAVTEPASPVSTTLNDSGYASPVHSPIPFNLPPDEETGLQSSPASHKQTRDAATCPSTPASCSSSTQTCQDEPQPIPPTFPATHDAAVSTLVTKSTSCPTQTTATVTRDATLQATPPVTPLVPAQTTKKQKKRRKPRTTQPAPTTETACPVPSHDAATTYDPPPTVIPRWCRLCSTPILPDTKPLPHLLNCDGLPELLGAECEGLFNDWSETFDMSPDTLATMTELLLTSFDPGSPEPPTQTFNSKDFLISKLIPRSCQANLDKFPQFWSNLNAVTTSLDTECRKLLLLPPTDSLATMFSNTDPESNETTDVDAGDLTEYVPHHPLDELDDSYNQSNPESDCYDYYEY